ncbi:MAG: hypothetical protein JW737_03185 [Acidobacteria bacterium]|nr:hypothetical protein [Acidobacteriota bacterium]
MGRDKISRPAKGGSRSHPAIKKSLQIASLPLDLTRDGPLAMTLLSSFIGYTEDKS